MSDSENPNQGPSSPELFSKLEPLVHLDSANSNNMTFNEERIMIKSLIITKRQSEDLAESLDSADKVKNNQNQLNAKVKSKTQKTD